MSILDSLHAPPSRQHFEASSYASVLLLRASETAAINLAERVLTQHNTTLAVDVHTQYNGSRLCEYHALGWQAPVPYSNTGSTIIHRNIAATNSMAPIRPGQASPVLAVDPHSERKDACEISSNTLRKPGALTFLHIIPQFYRFRPPLRRRELWRQLHLLRHSSAFHMDCGCE